MGSFRQQHSRYKHRNKNDEKRRRPEHRPRTEEIRELMQPGNTGSESDYLKSLIDSHAKVTVVLKSGERFQGHIRYYDRYCFSIGLSATGPRLFIRKDSVSYIAE